MFVTFPVSKCGPYLKEKKKFKSENESLQKGWFYKSFNEALIFVGKYLMNIKGLKQPEQNISMKPYSSLKELTKANLITQHSTKEI